MTEVDRMIADFRAGRAEDDPYDVIAALTDELQRLRGLHIEGCLQTTERLRAQINPAGFFAELAAMTRQGGAPYRATMFLDWAAERYGVELHADADMRS